MKNCSRPDHQKDFVRTIEGLSRRHDKYRVFSDWVGLASNSLLAHSSPWHAEEAEADYMAIVKRWKPDELQEMCRLLAITTLALEEKPQDFLGACFMELEIGNKHAGQFFTPYELSLVTAQMTVGDLDPTQDLITFQEPACGSGGMVIAFTEALRSRGVNPQTHTYTVAIDVSEVAARMTYVQLSLLGIPAHVVLGNSLSLEVRKQWPTLALGRVAHKVARWRRENAEAARGEKEKAEAAEQSRLDALPPVVVQPDLFNTAA